MAISSLAAGFLTDDFSEKHSQRPERRRQVPRSLPAARGGQEGQEQQQLGEGGQEGLGRGMQGKGVCERLEDCETAARLGGEQCIFREVCCCSNSQVTYWSPSTADTRC